MNRREFNRVCSTFCGIHLMTGILTNSSSLRADSTDVNCEISDQEMDAVYREAQTPYKYGVVIPENDGDMVDCPNLFHKDSAWYMIYVRMTKNVGYEGCIARSDDLLHWKPLGTILSFKKEGWDAWQASPSVALVDHNWGGSGELLPFKDKYWFTYLGGAGKGYEPDPLKIGVAWTDKPTEVKEWIRHPLPIMAPEDSDARMFEKTTLYKTNVIWDKEKRLGAPFIVYYNGKALENKKSVERIGMAISDDMIHWHRYGTGPVIDNGSGISGDPQLVRMGDLWVMFYFGAFWKPKAFDTFACSRDLVHWRKWQGPPLIAPSEPWDNIYAHKPWLIKVNGIVYHFYCAVGDKGRGIALATSKPVK